MTSSLTLTQHLPKLLTECSAPAQAGVFLYAT